MLRKIKLKLTNQSHKYALLSNYPPFSKALLFNFGTKNVKNHYSKNIPIEKLRISQTLKDSCTNLNYDYLTPI